MCHIGQALRPFVEEIFGGKRVTLENLKWDGTGPFPDALKSQSRWSAAGAACAGMAALSQSLAVVLPYLQSN